MTRFDCGDLIFARGMAYRVQGVIKERDRYIYRRGVIISNKNTRKKTAGIKSAV